MNSMLNLYQHLTQPGGRSFGPSSPGWGRTRRHLSRFALGLSLFTAFGIVPQARALGGTDEASLIVAIAALSGRVHHPRANTLMKRQWGIEPMYVRQTAAGYMLEFRYRVIDPVKAGPLFERQIKPLLTHAESGTKLIVPTPAKTGALRNSNPPLAGHTYWMYFANPGKLVKPGEHVNIEIGDFRLEGAVVN